MKGIFHINDSPSRLALAFAYGIFIAFSPTIGLHTISCLVLAWVFRLSKLVVLTAAFFNNPWTIVPLYGFCLWFGVKITGSTVVVPDISWQALTLSNAYSMLRPYLWPFVAGTLIIGTIAAVISYFIIYWAIIRYRQSMQK